MSRLSLNKLPPLPPVFFSLPLLFLPFCTLFPHALLLLLSLSRPCFYFYSSSSSSFFFPHPDPFPRLPPRSHPPPPPPPPLPPSTRDVKGFHAALVLAGGDGSVWIRWCWVEGVGGAAQRGVQRSRAWSPWSQGGVRWLGGLRVFRAEKARELQQSDSELRRNLQPRY